MTEFGMAWRQAKSLIQHGTRYKERLGHYYKGVTLSLADKKPANLGISFLLCLVLINAPICIANNHYTPEMLSNFYT